MPAPTWASVGAAAVGSGTSIVTNAPSGVAVGDLLVISVINISGLFNTIDTPSGWTLVDTATEGSGTIRGTAFYKLADGTGGDTPTLTVSGSAVFYVCVINHFTQNNSGTVFDVKAKGSSTSTANPPVPAITTTQTQEIAHCFIGIPSDTPSWISDPSTWTRRSLDGDPSGIALATFTKAAPSVGSYGGETAAITPAEQYVAINMAFFGQSDPVDPGLALDMSGASCGL